ncbi:hypothetical protein NECID01_0972 [Nematocida sp. AWRm77]|nr:hypothetical protein NECID01_0972 [Nematocida sp. AWRm77]
MKSLLSAEYLVSEEFLFAFQKAFVTYRKTKEEVLLTVYFFPAVPKQTYSFFAEPALSDFSVWVNTEQTHIVMKADTTQQQHMFSITSEMLPQIELPENLCVSVEVVASEDAQKHVAVCINGQKIVFSEESTDIFYHSPQDMLLYTLVPSSGVIREYALFNVQKMHPSGIALLYADKLKGYFLPHKGSARIQYSPGTLSSVFHSGGVMDTLLSSASSVVHEGLEKPHPQGFSPDKIYNRKSLIYLYSSASEKLLVLDARLEVKYTILVSGIFFTDTYVFMCKDGKTVAHNADTFQYAFFVDGLLLDASVAAIEVLPSSILVVSEKSLSKKSTPLFSLVFTEYFIEEQKVVQKVPEYSHPTALYQGKVFSLKTAAEGTPYVTTGIKDISAVTSGDAYILHAVTATTLLVVSTHCLIEIPLSAVETPFFWTEHCAFSGSAVRIDALKGVLLVMRREVVADSIFPCLLRLYLETHIPGELLFSLYGSVPEFIAGIQKTLFHFLDTDDIEKVIDILDAVKLLDSGVYSNIVSTMLRLLDEQNVKKLYAVIGPSTIKSFSDAECLSKVVLQDTSLFGKFLECAISEKKENLVYDFVQFVSKLSLPDLHEKILESLLEKNMLFLSGVLLMSSEYKNSSSSPVEKVFVSVSKAISTLQASEDPASLLEETVKRATDPLFVEMLCEGLSLLEMGVHLSRT